jgi:DNA-binding transcriptional LysR family regulator
MNPLFVEQTSAPPAVLAAHLEKLRRRDLNALVTLYAVLRTRNVSGAARLLGITQPAVSRILDRLRAEFDDPLVVRQGNGVVATNRARELDAALEGLMDHAQHIFSSSAFQPSTVRRDVHLAMNEHLQQLLVPPLLERTAQHAPGMRLFVRSILRSDMELLKDGHLDLILGMLSPDEPLREQLLMSQRLLCIGQKDLVRKLTRGSPLALHTFGQQPQIDVRPAALGQISALLDGLFKGARPQRNIVCVVSSFEALMNTLEAGRYIGVVPELAFNPRLRRSLDVVPLAFDLPSYRVSAWWHNVAHHDPALQWLLEQVLQVCTTFEGTAEPSARKPLAPGKGGSTRVRAR